MRIFNPKRFVPLLVIGVVALLAPWVGLVHGQSEDQLKFPYQAIVLHDDAKVSSGPGQAYYSTEKLAQGDVVEVYREDPGGWCAIRPVEGSFSLVPEATLEIVDAGVGRIRENGTQAWVGTQLGVVDKPMWQVKLQKDELVELIGQVSWPDPEGHSTIWYQIAPPAGEFRWIRMSDIQLPVDLSNHNREAKPEKSGLSDSVPMNTAGMGQAWPPTEVGGGPSDLPAQNLNDNPVQLATMQTEQDYPPANPSENTTTVNQGWRQATRSIGGRSKVGGAAFQRGPGVGTASDGSYSHASAEEFGNRAGFSLQPGYNPAVDNEAIRIASAETGSTGLARNLDSVRSPLGGYRGGRAGRPSRSIGALELQLTDEMLKNDPSKWRLQDLEIAASAILRTTLNPVERNAAEQYLAKLNNCKQIQAGFQGGTGSAPDPVKGLIGSGVKSDLSIDTTYDAHGWLTELVRNGGNSKSEYALQDENGNITHHVAAAPGMNLRRYLKSRVGVIGKRGYHSQLKLDHITAHRVIELEKAKPLFAN